MATKYSMEQVNKCRELYQRGDSVTLIGALMQMPVTTVSQIVNNTIRVDPAYTAKRSDNSSWRRWLSVEVDFIRENAGILRLDEIAAQLNRTSHAVRRMALTEGISLSTRSVDPHDAWLCQQLFKEGLKVGVIAEKMEMSRRTVSRIIQSEQIMESQNG